MLALLLAFIPLLIKERAHNDLGLELKSEIEIIWNLKQKKEKY